MQRRMVRDRRLREREIREGERGIERGERERESEIEGWSGR